MTQPHDVASVEQLVRTRDLPRLTAVLAELSVPEVLSVMRRLDNVKQALLYRVLDKDTAMEVFERLDPSMQSALVSGLRDDHLVRLVEGLDADDRVAFFDELPARVVDRLLHGLSAREREMTLPMLGHPAGSLGRSMTPQYVRLRRPGQTAAEALADVRSRGREADTIEMLPVTDQVRCLVGMVNLHDLVLADPTTTVSELVRPPVSRPARTPAEDAARLCLDLGLMALPVTDDEGRLIGILPIDNALRIVADAEAEDAARAGGAEPLRRPYLATPVLRIVRARTAWLLVLAVSAILTVGVLEQFEATLAEVVVLALFIPLLTGIGGNTGSQAATTVTRALALGDVRPRDLGRVAFREVRAGLTMGLLLGALGVMLATPFYGPGIGWTIGLTLVVVCPMAATVGGCMPLVAKALRVDPAVMSTPFISTFCDATGLVIYFLIARAILGL